VLFTASRRQLKRRHVLSFFQKVPPCLIGIEACASSHHWSRELQQLLVCFAQPKQVMELVGPDICDSKAVSQI
jgi:transposase